MSLDRIDAMRIFSQIAELGSFTQTAQSLSLPKASVSKAMQQLESQLGTQLLFRTTRKVTLTQDGEVYYQRCKDLLADMDELNSYFRQTANQLKGRLRIDMPVRLAKNAVIPRLSQFIAQHPLLDLEISSTDRRVDVIAEGFDCVVRVGHLNDSSLVAKPLGQLTSINCASPAYLEYYGIPQTLDDLKQHRLVDYVQTLGAKSRGFEYMIDGQLNYVDMPRSITVNNSEAYNAAALAGLGIVQIPHVGLRRHLEDGRLIQILPEFAIESMPVNLLYAKRRNLSRRTRVLMDWLTVVVADYLNG
jgi:DNA-binding transcriptional LysR family regulator